VGGFIIVMLLMLAIFAGIILLFIFWIFMIVDAAKRSFKEESEKVAWILVVVLAGIIGSIILIPFILPEFSLLDSKRNIAILSLLGIITFLAALFDFEALKKGKLSVIQVIIELELPLTVLIGFGLFKEYFTLLQGLLIIPILFGIVLMTISDSKKLKINLKKGIEKGAILAVLSALGMALINSITAYSSRSISPMMAIWFPWVIFTFVCMFIILFRGDFRETIKNAYKFKRIIIPMAILDTAAWIFYSHALSGYNMGIITAITESYPVIGIILGMTINKEKVKGYQFIGGIITLISSIILALTIL